MLDHARVLRRDDPRVEVVRHELMEVLECYSAKSGLPVDRFIEEEGSKAFGNSVMRFVNAPELAVGLEELIHKDWADPKQPKLDYIEKEMLGDKVLSFVKYIAESNAPFYFE